MLFKVVFFSVLCLLNMAVSVCAAPTVVVSIAPLHSIAAAVTEGVSAPELLLPPAVSVHDFHLKPSDMRRLSEADIVFWGGADLETGLVKALQAAGKGEKSVSFLNDSRLTVYPARGGGHHSLDGHFWLMPENMAVVAEIMAEKLAQADADNAEVYRQNAARVQKDMAGLKSLGTDMLKRYSQKPYVTFHDAYQYFEKSFGLSSLGSLFSDPHHAVGAAGIESVREKIRQSGNVCLFSEPQFSDKKIKTVAEGLPVFFGQADPVGTLIAPGKDFYKKLMTDLFRSFDACFKQLPEGEHI